MGKQFVALMIAIVVLFTMSSALASSLERSNRIIGSDEGVSFAENTGTLDFSYGRIWAEGASGMKDGTGAALDVSLSSLTKAFADTASLTRRYEDGASIEASFIPEADGTMTLHQIASNAEGGISAVSFRLKIPMMYDIIIPAWNGIRLSAENPVPYMSTLAYPNNWQAQMVLIDTPYGGLLVQADDDGTQFKQLDISNDGSFFYLDITTVPQAPFTGYTSFESVPWRFIPYEGDWINGALLYKGYMAEKFNLTAINAAKPAWADEVQLVCLIDMPDNELMDELAALVDPSKTIIHLVNTRVADYDTDYPNYALKAGVKEGIAYAHSLGFKVSIHANMIGAHLENQDFIARGLDTSVSLNAYTQEPVLEGYTANGRDYRFAQMNQASVAWQDLLIEQFTAIVQEAGFDVVHLDQSLLCFNDGRGLVNGMTSMQGNVELQKRLAEALPGVVFSGEGINEYNARYASFLQMHVYGLNNADRSWSEAQFDQILPLTNVLFSDTMKAYHYPALPTTKAADEIYYQAWYRAGNQRAGDILSLYRFDKADLQAPTDTMQMVLNDAVFNQTYQPELDLTPWGENVLLSLKLNNGKTAQWLRDEFGTYFVPDLSDPSIVSTRFVSGTEAAKISGTIPGWDVYDGEWLRGLDPDASYLVLPQARDLAATHVSAIEENLTTRTFETTDEYTVVAMKEIVSSNENTYDLMDYDGEMRAGETLYEGVTHTNEPFSSARAFDFLMLSQGHVSHQGDRVFFHPPWADEGMGIGTTWLEADVPLLPEYASCVFTATGSTSNLSDGVNFTISAWEKGDEAKANLISEVFYVSPNAPTPISLDISAFEGKLVTIRMEVDSYQYTAYDSSYLIGPMVKQTREGVEKTITYEVTTEKPVAAMFSLSGAATRDEADAQRIQITSGLYDTVFLAYGAEPSAETKQLAITPWVSNLVSGEGASSIPLAGSEPFATVNEVANVLSYGVQAIPPKAGSVRMNYMVFLPDEPMAFTAMLGISESSSGGDGVSFRVLVNEEAILTEKVLPGEAFHSVSADLGAYASTPILLTLEVSADGDDAGDLAFWGEPKLMIP